MIGVGSDLIRVTALLCTALLVPGDVLLMAQEQPAQPKPPAQAPAKTADELDSLVAPIALYPDPLLAQVLAASTYPLEIVQAQRWVKANATLKGEELTRAASKEPWDPSVQALVAFPDALKFLDDNLKWTTDLGNAFLDQQSEVMDAIQRMRKKAQENGKLESTKEQKIETKTVENKTVIEIQPANPQVVYVPSYNPTVVYGPPVYPYYPYPPIYYPTGAYIATAAISFGVGVALGAFWGGCCGGGWGWGCGWGGNNIQINNNFHNRYGYNNINNIQGGNRLNGSNRSNTWQHNPTHRQSVPYGSRDTAQRFGGSAREPGGGVQRFDRSGQPRAEQGLGQRGGGVAAKPDRVGDRSIGGQDRAAQKSALGGGESRGRTQASSNRGYSSSWQSRGGGGGGGGATRGGGGGGRTRGGGRRR